MERLSKKLSISLVAMLLFTANAFAIPTCTDDRTNHQYICEDTFGPQTSNFNLSVPLPQFNSALGTLLKIEHFASAHLLAEYEILNRGNTEQNFTLEAQSTVSMRYGSPSGPLILQVVPWINETFMVGGLTLETVSRTADLSNAGIAYNAPFNVTVPPYTSTYEQMYVGNGFVPFYIDVVSTAAVRGSGNFMGGATVTTNGIAQVIYTYSNEIPEPATMLLMGSSLLAAAFLRKSKALSA